MPTSVFPESTFVNVTVQGTPSLPAEPNINTLGIVTQDPVPSTWASGQAYAQYSTLTGVGVDFGINSNTYAIAQAAFAQRPNFISAGGYLVVIPRLQSPSLESVQACIERTSPLVFYFGVVIDQELAASSPSTFATLAAYIQTQNKMFFYTSSNPNDVNSGSPLDLVRQASDSQTRCAYYGSPLLNGAGAQQTQIFSAAAAGRLLGVNFNGVNTAITLQFQQLAGIVGDQTVTPTMYQSAQSSGVDLDINVSGNGFYVSNEANQFADQVINQLWLAMDIETNVFDILAGVGSKVPQTTKGVNQLVDGVAQSLIQGVRNRFLARGAWPVKAQTFGNTALLLSSIEKLGWYVYANPISGQSQSQLKARQAPPIQAAALSAGAIHTAAIIVQVSI